MIEPSLRDLCICAATGGQSVHNAPALAAEDFSGHAHVMHVLERTQVLPRPRAEVFAFFSDAANLERLTPPSLSFTILTPLPIAIATGSVIDYRIRLSGIPMTWRTVIAAFEPGARFVDVQARGPYRTWRHTHSFRDVPGGTEVRDRVEYELPLGPLGRLVHTLVVRRQLRTIFDYRAQVMCKLFGTN